MSLVYFNENPVGQCSSFELQKVDGSSNLIKLREFSFLQPDITSEQNEILTWLLQETEVVKEYNFHPTGIIGELLQGRNSVPIHLKDIWLSMVEYERQQVLFMFLAIKTGYSSSRTIQN